VDSARKDATATSPRSIDVYRSSVKSAFDFLKRTETIEDAYAKGIRIGEGLGVLLPVCDLTSRDDDAIRTLAEWRRACSWAFPSQFEITDDGTRRWLIDGVLGRPDRMLFFVVDPTGKPIGHLGFANALNDEFSMELDNVVRGAVGKHPGLMAAAVRALIAWAEETLWPDRIFLRTFSDNEHAIGFYKAIGFVEGGLLPLRRVEEPGGIRFEPADGGPVDKHFLRMDYAPPRPQQVDELILTAGPSMSAREAFYSQDAVRSGWNRSWSGYLDKFEASCAEYVGVEHAIATSSCTGALHLALLALGVGPGDEVVVPDETWVASATSVVYTGATPVFADIELGGWGMDPDSFERAITSRTKAVIPVHMYGHPARMDRITDVAKTHGIAMVEDAAPSIGSECDGRKTGSFGDFAAFSFQGAKMLVTGEGGMLLTNDADLYRRVRKIWDQGRNPNRTFWIDELGWKYKMSNVQAALGLAQLERVDEQVDAKRRIFSWYEQGLRGLPGLQLQVEQSWARCNYWMSSAIVTDDAPVTRDDLIAALRVRNVDTRPVFPAISQYPIWPRQQAPQPNAFYVGSHGLNLPSGVGLRRWQVDYVCEQVRQVFHDASGQS
jgi:perosamine synthetase